MNATKRLKEKMGRRNLPDVFYRKTEDGTVRFLGWKIKHSIVLISTKFHFSTKGFKSEAELRAWIRSKQRIRRTRSPIRLFVRDTERLARRYGSKLSRNRLRDNAIRFMNTLQSPEPAREYTMTWTETPEMKKNRVFGFLDDHPELLAGVIMIDEIHNGR